MENNDGYRESFREPCSPIRDNRTTFTKEIYMSSIKTPNNMYDDDDKLKKLISQKSSHKKIPMHIEYENLRLFAQQGWLSKHANDKTLLSLRSMTITQRNTYRALFDRLDTNKTGKVSLKQLCILLQSMNADIKFANLVSIIKHNNGYGRTYYLNFVQFCELLLRNDINIHIKVLKNNANYKLNQLRKKRLKDLQFIKCGGSLDTPTQSQQKVIELKRKLDNLNKIQNNIKNNNDINNNDNNISRNLLSVPSNIIKKRRSSKQSKQSKQTSAQITSRSDKSSHSSLSFKKFDRKMITKTKNSKYTMEIDKFISNWHRRELLKELKKHNYLTKKTVNVTMKYINMMDDDTNNIFSLKNNKSINPMIYRSKLLNTLTTIMDKKSDKYRKKFSTKLSPIIIESYHNNGANHSEYSRKKSKGITNIIKSLRESKSMCDIINNDNINSNFMRNRTESTFKELLTKTIHTNEYNDIRNIKNDFKNNLSYHKYKMYDINDTSSEKTGIIRSLSSAGLASETFEGTRKSFFKTFAERDCIKRRASQSNLFSLNIS